jgi:hypothetical protein
VSAFRAPRLGAAAAVLGASAGVGELAVGTHPWLGDKEDPVTLGWVTVALAIVVGVAALTRPTTPGRRLVAGTLLLVAGLVGLTTAGLAWLPAAALAVASGAGVLRGLDGPAEAIATIGRRWPAALLLLLAPIPLTFGIVGRRPVLVGAAAAIVAAAALRPRCPRASTGCALLAAACLAAGPVWTVVLPSTSVLVLALALWDDQLGGRTRGARSATMLHRAAHREPVPLPARDVARPGGGRVQHG